MKAQLVYLIVGLLTITSINGQIKIGENPQNLDPASVLELESTSRALVITRVTDTQMNNISPLRGALVYNTDQECIHYYNGIEWINICEALDNSFTTTTEAIFNTASLDNTVVVTQIDDNYNFEVNLITGDNIIDNTIFGSDLAFSTITDQQLQDGAITLNKLADGNPTANGELLRWDGIAWSLIDQSTLVVTEVDGEVGNEVLDATAGGSLTRSGLGSDVNPFTLDVTDGGINTDELANNAVTSDKINANVAGNGLSQAANGSLEIDNANITPDWNNIVNIPADIDDGDDDTTYAAGAGITLGAGNTFSVNNLGGDVTGPTNATVIANGAVNSAKIADGTITNDDIAPSAAIDGSKINPVFITDVTTTGDFIDLTPDFVFEKYFDGFSNLNNDYRFRSLKEVEEFIRNNKHLPGIKSAHEIKAANEYRLTESSLGHLEKIEELFLHTIEQEKKIEELSSENQKLKEELNSLKSEVQAIKELILEENDNK